MRTFATLFAGGGLADIGIQAAGYEPLWGVEYDPKKWGSDVADWAKTQLRSNIVAENILNLYPGYMDRPDHLHASPPCPSFSTANNKRGETENDLALARKVAEFIDVLRPNTFTLENVYMYRKSQSWQIIKAALDSSGYTHEYEHVNFADLGVPQTRKRMIVRATLSGGLVPLPDPEPWKGWYQAIEDLIPDLPETELAPWQIKRLRERGIIVDEDVLLGQGNWSSPKPKGSPADSVTRNSNQGGVKAILIPSGNSTSFPTREGTQPANTIGDTKRVGNIHKALLVGHSTSNALVPRESDDPATVVTQNSTRKRAILVTGENSRSNGRRTGVADHPAFGVSTAGQMVVYLEDCKVVKITPRCLARFQTLPDWYELPEKKSLAVTIIGNGVPCLGMQKIMETFDERGDDRPHQISMFTT